ncbi:TPA: hypothetical protein ACOAXM_004162, partial [Vibrio cholerae]
MSYLTTTGRLYFLSLTRPVTHLCYNISYNTIYYYMIVSVMAVIRGNTGAGDQRKVPNYRARNKT